MNERIFADVRYGESGKRSAVEPKKMLANKEVLGAPWGNHESPSVPLSARAIGPLARLR